MRRSLLILATVLAVAVGGGIAWASIPGPGGVINGCYKKSNPNAGSVIIIDSGASCPNGYNALNWNQQGVPGQNGVSGYEFVYIEPRLTFSPNGWAGSTAFCPSNYLAVGGGGDADYSLLDLVQTTPSPTHGPPNGWAMVWRNRSSDPLELQVTISVICIATPS